MAAGDWACNHKSCDSQPGEPCVNEDGTLFCIRGARAFHAERIEADAAMSGNDRDGVNFTPEQIGMAVAESGLI